MICGPIVPNTLTSLRDVIEQEVGRIERGLRTVATDIVFGQQGEVDILSLKEMVMLMRAPSADEDHTSRIFIPAKSSLEAIGKKPPASDSEA